MRAAIACSATARCVSVRWHGVLMRPAIKSGGRPVYCQTTLMTGILISGKISVGERRAASGPMSSSNASTTKVYGRCRAMRTMPSMEKPERNGAPH